MQDCCSGYLQRAAITTPAMDQLDCAQPLGARAYP